MAQFKCKLQIYKALKNIENIKIVSNQEKDFNFGIVFYDINKKINIESVIIMEKDRLVL